MKRKFVIAAIVLAVGLTGFAKPTEPNYENLNAILWVQTSVEYKAAALQSYRLAEREMATGLADPHWTAALEQTGPYLSLPPAVVLDLDETVLDNSRFQVRTMLAGGKFDPAAWDRWVSESAAGLVPGAMDFLQVAVSEGVKPIYITNRKCDPTNAHDPTVVVLQNLHIPIDADSLANQLLCSEGGSDKSSRRARTAAKYRILLLIGDQLGDFLSIPSNDVQVRDDLFQSHDVFWGTRWIQLPNPTYGSWIDALGTDKTSYLRK